MKKMNFLITLISVLLISANLSAQSQEDMKAFMNYMTPGPIQQMMAKSAGSWTGVVTMWMQPGAPPTTSTLETNNEMILGGRYLQGMHKGTMMGMPFEGMGTTGYDNARKIFVSSWVDNMGTGLLYMEGSWNENTKSITMTGKSTDPLTGKDIPTREIWKFVDDTHQVLEMYFTEKGQEFKGMEIAFTKK
ncbi:MAG TPA: DUF1579 domain-containing protein [Puia sp.]|jgi:hypothetical protein